MYATSDICYNINRSEIKDKKFVLEVSREVDGIE